MALSKSIWFFFTTRHQQESESRILTSWLASSLPSCPPPIPRYLPVTPRHKLRRPRAFRAAIKIRRCNLDRSRPDCFSSLQRHTTHGDDHSVTVTVTPLSLARLWVPRLRGLHNGAGSRCMGDTRAGQGVVSRTLGSGWAGSMSRDLYETESDPRRLTAIVVVDSRATTTRKHPDAREKGKKAAGNDVDRLTWRVR